MQWRSWRDELLAACRCLRSGWVGETVQTGSLVCLFVLPLSHCCSARPPASSLPSLLHLGSLASPRLVMSSAPINNLKKTFGLTSEELADGRIATLEDIGRQKQNAHTRRVMTGRISWRVRWNAELRRGAWVRAAPHAGPTARCCDQRQTGGGARPRAPCPCRPHGFVRMQSYRNDARMLIRQ